MSGETYISGVLFIAIACLIACAATAHKPIAKPNEWANIAFIGGVLWPILLGLLLLAGFISVLWLVIVAPFFALHWAVRKALGMGPYEWPHKEREAVRKL